MHLIMCWPNPSHANEDSKCISTCVEQWHRWQKMHLNMCWPKRQRGHKMHLNWYWPKTLLCERGHKIYLNMYWRKPIQCHRGLQCFSNMWWSNITYTNEDTKSLTYQWGKKIISACVVKARTQNVSQHELTKHFPWERGHKMLLKMCWPNAYQASEDTKFIAPLV